MFRRFFVLAAAVVGLVAGSASADILTLNSVSDNTMWQNATGGISNGAGETMFVGTNDLGIIRRALVRFDTSAIPAGSVVTAVQVKLYMSRTTAPTNSVTLHRALGMWGEGTSNAQGGEGGGSVATTNDATWTHRLHPLFPWSTSGGDFIASPSATLSVGGIATYTWSSTQLVADVQGWIDAPATNFGWILKGDETQPHTAKRFNARESGSAVPQLIITFTPGAASGACCLPDTSCQVLSPTACAAAGGTYQGTGVPCGQNTCVGAIGACCMPDGSCSVQTQADCTNQGGVYRGNGTTCTAGLCPVSLTPFVDALPLPGVAQPIQGQPGGAATYDVPILRVHQQLHRDLPPTVVYGYYGQYPGPTIEATRGLPVNVTYRNELRDDQGNFLTDHDLDVETCMHGPAERGTAPATVTHIHGGRVDSISDGQPELTQLPGQSSPVYVYPNNQDPATIWYHDHALGTTRLNVYMGLAGFYLIRDAQEQALGLPSGAYEVPLAIQDRSFAADGSLRYPTMGQGDDHYFGDTMLVNGKVWPFMEVRRGKYRFRMLNGCNSRTLTLALSNGQPMWRIGTEGGLLAAPVEVTSVTISPGERADMVIDFGPLDPGTEVLLVNSAPAPFPGTPGVGVIPNVMKFVVQEETGSPGPLPQTLRTITPIPESSAARTRTFMLERINHPCMGFMWTINGLMWDDITEFPRFNDVEIWSFVNNSGVVHPMHIHLVQFQVLDTQDCTIVNGVVTPVGPRVPPSPDEAGWKDTVRAMPFQITRVIARFDGFGGTYPYHCHILEHEDHEMMRQFRVTCWVDIIGQPRDTIKPYNGTASFFADATGAGALTYEWRKGTQVLTNGVTPHGSTISGATTFNLRITSLRPEDAGGYRCIVRDQCGPLSSRTATLTVFPTCDPDFNDDGNSDQDDVTYLVNAVAGGDNPNNRDLDFNRDGNVDQDDVAALVNVVAGGGCP